MQKFDGEVMNITIAEHSSKLTKNGATLVKITDTTGKKYSFFSTKKDGSQTAAYIAFQQLGNPVGKTVEVGFKSEPYTWTFEGKTGEGIRNKILFMEEVNKDGNYEVGTTTEGKNPNGTFKPGEGSLDEELPF